jgi:hypothetical protein
MKRVKGRNAETKRVQTQLYRDFKRNIMIMHDIEDHVEIIRNLIPQMKPLESLYHTKHKTRVKYRNDAQWQDLDISLWFIPIEEVVDKFAGPIHRYYDVDWNMSVRDPNHICLQTQIPGITKKHVAVTVNLHVYEGFPQCNVVAREVEAKTYHRVEYKVVCS